MHVKYTEISIRLLSKEEKRLLGIAKAKSVSNYERRKFRG